MQKELSSACARAADLQWKNQSCTPAERVRERERERLQRPAALMMDSRS